MAMDPRSSNRTATLARLLVPTFLLVMAFGCSSQRFQLANRDDTLYERQIAAADVRVPVNGGPPVPTTPAIVATPVVPAISGPGPESFAANVPAVPANPTPPSPIDRPLLVETPRPGPPGTRLDPAVTAVELVGRVVNPLGQPAPRVPIQVLDPRQNENVVAEVATDDYGMFRVRNLSAGLPYRLVATSRAADGQLVGSISATPPDTAVVLQLQLENLISGRSVLGNRLASNGPLQRASIPAPGPPSAVSLPNDLPGKATVVTATLATAPPEGAPRVLPPSGATVQATSIDAPTQSSPAGKEPGERSSSQGSGDVVATARPITNIDWDDAPADQPKDAPSTQFAGAKDPTLDLLSDLPLPDAPAKPTAVASEKKVAFAGTGLEFARVYDLSGTQWPLGALDGDLILLDFFGSWCGPCRKSIPHLNELDARYSGQGLRIVGVACEYGDATTALQAANDAKSRLNIRYHVVVSPMDETSAVRDYFKVGSYPTVILLDRQGHVLFQGTGLDSATVARLENAIQEALANR